MSWRDKLSEADRQRIQEAVQPFRENPDYQQAATQGKNYDEGQTSEFNGNLNDHNHPAGQFQHDKREQDAAQQQREAAPAEAEREAAPAEPEPSAAQLEAEQARDMQEIDAEKSPEQHEQERSDYENGMSAQYEAEQAEGQQAGMTDAEIDQAVESDAQTWEAIQAEREGEAPTSEVSEPEAEPQQLEMELGDDD